ncbi:MAG: outer membrane protein assembly factor BamC [Methylomonas sp.]
MNKTIINRGLAILVLLQFSTACSTIKSWFPDKERDYQFRSEIAPLIIPDDLKAKTASLAMPVANGRTPEQMAAAAVAQATKEAQVTAATPVKKAESETKTPPAKAAGSGVSSLQIDQSQTQSARLVGRALSRQKLEIVERNIDKGYFYIKFDPHAVKAEDKDFWDELNFMFGEDPSNEQEYRITLQEIAPQSTEVTIQDSDGKSLSNSIATNLLKLIAEAINQDLATPAGAGDKSVP